MAKKNMLPPKDGSHFFELFLPLLAYADLEHPLIFGDASDMMQRAAVIWDNPARIDDFIDDVDHKKSKMRITLTDEDREILRSWKRCRRDVYYLASHRLNGALIVSQKDQVYRVLGLQSSLQELMPKTPIMLMATLLPWKDKLITDGLFMPVPILHPDDIQKHLQEVCQQALDQGTVITTI